MSDEELIDLYKENQGSVHFDLLYDRYSNKVFGKCMTILKDRSLAEDATQEIFIKVLLNLNKFKGNSKFSTWLYSITYNFCIDFVRKRNKRRVIYREEIKDIEDNTEDVLDSEILGIKIERLEKVMSAIEPTDRAILMMKYAENMPIKEMAEILKKTESATKMKIMRAKQRIKRTYKNIYNE